MGDHPVSMSCQEGPLGRVIGIQEGVLVEFQFGRWALCLIRYFRFARILDSQSQKWLRIEIFLKKASVSEKSAL